MMELSQDWVSWIVPSVRDVSVFLENELGFTWSE